MCLRWRVPQGRERQGGMLDKLRAKLRLGQAAQVLQGTVQVRQSVERTSTLEIALLHCDAQSKPRASFTHAVDFFIILCIYCSVCHATSNPCGCVMSPQRMSTEGCVSHHRARAWSQDFGRLTVESFALLNGYCMFVCA